jgi:Sulfotransferase family
MTELARPTPATPGGDLSWQAMRRYFPGRRMVRYLLPVPEHGIIYVKNPKAGCSTILMWLDRLHTGEYDVELGDIHQNNRLPTVRDVGRSAVVRMLSGRAYRFSFVRHPLRRFESVYWDKMVYNLKWRKNVPAALGLDLSPDTIVSFEQFLSIVEEQDPVSEMDPHWRPQHINLMHPLVSYDHLGRLESFATDLEHIREAAGLPHVPLEVRNTARHTRTDSVYDGRPDLVRRVERIYATDFELYGY